jgi:hypothetical protein
MAGQQGNAHDPGCQKVTSTLPFRPRCAKRSWAAAWTSWTSKVESMRRGHQPLVDMLSMIPSK